MRSCSSLIVGSVIGTQLDVNRTIAKVTGSIGVVEGDKKANESIYRYRRTRQKIAKQLTWLWKPDKKQMRTGLQAQY